MYGVNNFLLRTYIIRNIVRLTVEKKHNNFIASNRGKEKLKNMKNKEKIIEIDRMAKEAGMSYGQYVGLNNL